MLNHSQGRKIQNLGQSRTFWHSKNFFFVFLSHLSRVGPYKFLIKGNNMRCSDISEQPKKVGEFIEVKPDLDYVRKVRCYLVSTHFIIAREKVNVRNNTVRYQIVLELSS